MLLVSDFSGDGFVTAMTSFLKKRVKRFHMIANLVCPGPQQSPFVLDL